MHIPMIFGNVGFRVRLFLFRARREASAPAHAPYLRPVGNDADGRSLQGGAPTVGALGDAALDENRCAINLAFSGVLGIGTTSNLARQSRNQNMILTTENTEHTEIFNLFYFKALFFSVSCAPPQEVPLRCALRGSN